MIKVGNSSVIFKNVYLKSSSAIGGKKELVGPLGSFLDYAYTDAHCNENTWEEAEIALIDKALKVALEKCSLTLHDIDLMILGDLNNQLVISHYLMRKYDIPFFGIYSACATCVQSIMTGAMLIDGGFGKYIMCGSSSHFATSERQFRYPTEYGGQKPTSLTSTATGAGIGILSNMPSFIKITAGTIGKIIDAGLTDANDLGRAMAPAAAETLFEHLHDFQTTIDDYDLIVTGDLSTYGSKIFKEMLKGLGIDLKDKHVDGGLLLYNVEKQKVHAGGSGSGCISMVLYGYLVKRMYEERFKRILVIATGALMNPIMICQGETIPCIAHAIVLERSN